MYWIAQIWYDISSSSYLLSVVDESKNKILLQWAEAIESLDYGSPGSDRSFGMKQRPDGDIEIDEKFWEEDFHIPTCQKCNGVLKPDVSTSLSLIEVNSISIFFTLVPADDYDE